MSPPVLKRSLPAPLDERLLKGNNFSYIVAIEAKDASALRAMDDYLKIGISDAWQKLRELEVDKSEIHKFSHFYVNPQPYDRGSAEPGASFKGDVYFHETRPTCHFNNCYWGARSSGPFEIAPKALKKLKHFGVGRLIGAWEARLWLMTPQVKELFESESITGLSYEPCILKGGGKEAIGTPPPAYVASMPSVSYSRAQHASINHPNKICPEHRYVSGLPAFGERYARKDLQDVDIQVHGGVYLESNRSLYRFRHGGIVVTRRALELMLEHKVSGLAGMTAHLKEKFLPVLLDIERSNPLENLQNYE